MPKMLHIQIFSGITEKAMQILADRLHSHIQTGKTKIVIKRHVKSGRYIYSTWLSIKELEHMSKEALLLRLQKLTNNGSKKVHLIVRQNLAHGFIQDLWERKHSLL